MSQRSIPMPPPEGEPKRLAQVATITRDYRLITPLFGGGVTASENDVSMLIRATSIRGQLRFWWRACFGGSHHATNNERLADMFERESALWGSAATKDRGNPSRVRVQVQVTNSGNAFHVKDRFGAEIHVSEMRSPYGYAAFPLQDKKHLTVREGVEFTLTLHVPATLNTRDLADELEKTLWAWETFGGIGARTRRGFGVLQRKDGASAFPFQTTQQLREHLRKIVVAGTWPEHVPQLDAAMRLQLVKPDAQPLATWATLLKRYKAFRQHRNQGSDPQQPNRPGRSRWPEPDALRRIAPNPRRKHQPTNPVNAFPRAHFGLPIIFHFKDKDDPNATLKPQGYDRFASPMILKPVTNGRFHAGLLAVLHNSSLGGIAVVTDLSANPVTVDLSQAETNQLKRNDRTTPLLHTATGQPTTDVFEAFFAEFSPQEVL